MYLANIRGMWKTVRHKPQLVMVSTLNLRHRLTHKYFWNRRNGNSHPPEVLTVFVTDRCNMRCRECHYANSDTVGYRLNQVGDMDKSIFRKLLDEISGNPIVSFTGGEPLLHPLIDEFILYAKDKGKFCTLVTNGWMLEERAEEICHTGLDILTVSLDGPEEIHNHIRGKRSYERLIKGLEKVMEQPERPIVMISMAISDLNFNQVVPTYELVKGLNVDGMNVNHLWMQTCEMVQTFNTRFSIFPADLVAWDVQPEKIDVDKLADDLEEIRRRNWGNDFLFSEAPYLNRDEISQWYREPELPVKYETVRCGWMRFKVWPDGKVKPCRDWVVGDIRQQHVMEIWNGTEYQKFRKLLTDFGLLPICTRCCQIALR